jgi:hypothetical protein
VLLAPIISLVLPNGIAVVYLATLLIAQLKSMSLQNQALPKVDLAQVTLPVAVNMVLLS